MRLACAAALTMLLAAGAEAQGRADAVYITLTGDVCEQFMAGESPRHLWVVTNGSDIRFPATPVPGSDCNWRLGLKDKRLNLDISRFSLRLGGVGRTNCISARRNEAEFHLVFITGGKGPAREMQIEPGSFDYVREVTEGNDGDTPCREVGSARDTLHDVQFDIEDVRLQLFEQKTVACGVILDGVPALGKAKKGDVVEVTYKESVPMVVKQGAEGKNCHAPTFIPPEAIEPSLRRKARLVITVK